MSEQRTIEQRTGRTYVNPVHLVTTTDGACPEGHIEIETVLEAPMLRDLLRRTQADVERLTGEKDHWFERYRRLQRLLFDFNEALGNSHR